MNENFNNLENKSLFKLNSHAFLIEVDESYNTEFILNIVKNYIIDVVSDERLCSNILNLIDKKIFPDLKIIVPDGKFIKKEQMLELMNNFNCKSIYNLKKIYIIEYAENLNQSSANAILKFLEEPNDDIIAILITKNKFNVLETIVSRCQLINFNLYRRKTYNEEELKKALNYVKIIEYKKEKAVAYLSELYAMKTDELKDIFNIFILIYDDVLKMLINNENIIFNEFKLEIEEISKYCNMKKIVSKIKLIEHMINLNFYNVNSRVILDLLVVGD